VGFERRGITTNTNLAAEFHVLSILYRLGADASLTLGNKKSVDIVVTYTPGQTARIDVKGVAGPHDWPCDNIRLPAPDNRFIVLVSFEGRIADPGRVPSVWVVPANEIAPFIKVYEVRKIIIRSVIRAQGARYLHGWSRILEGP
jgi:hypothetical protein